MPSRKHVKGKLIVCAACGKPGGTMVKHFGVYVHDGDCKKKPLKSRTEVVALQPKPDIVAAKPKIILPSDLRGGVVRG